MTVWFATGNLNKKAELSAILNDNGCDCEVLTPADAGISYNPNETESTFYGNAMLKARGLYSLLRHCKRPIYTGGDPIIADDSGICVDALDGRPGVFSARYTGKTELHAKISTVLRNVLLLEELGDNPMRNAHFACAMVLLFNPDRFYFAQETCEGELVINMDHSSGEGGFGYDPIFYLPEFGKTMAEISEAEKNRISHRGKAGKVIAGLLREFNREPHELVL